MAQIVENIKTLKNQRQSTEDLRLAAGGSRNSNQLPALSFGQSDYDKDMYNKSPKRSRLQPLNQGAFEQTQRTLAEEMVRHSPSKKLNIIKKPVMQDTGMFKSPTSKQQVVQQQQQIITRVQDSQSQQVNLTNCQVTIINTTNVYNNNSEHPTGSPGRPTRQPVRSPSPVYHLSPKPSKR